MVATRHARLPGCFVMIGYPLMLAAVAAVLFALAIAKRLPDLGETAQDQVQGRVADWLRGEAARLGEVPPELVDDLVDDGRVEPGALEGRPLRVRLAVLRLTLGRAYLLKRAGERGRAGLGILGIFLALTLAGAGPAFVVGWLLTLKRPVWHCQGCGFWFPRA